MIISEVLDAIDNINSITIESEIDTCKSLLFSYDKMLLIEEHYEGNDINDFKIFQEGVLSDAKDDVKKQNEGKSTLNKILFTIPRMIVAIVKQIINLLKGTKKKAEDIDKRTKTLPKETKGLLAKLFPKKSDGKVNAKEAVKNWGIAIGAGAAATAGVVGGTKLANSVITSKNNKKITEQFIKNVKVDDNSKKKLHEQMLALVTYINDYYINSIKKSYGKISKFKKLDKVKQVKYCFNIMKQLKSDNKCKELCEPLRQYREDLYSTSIKELQLKLANGKIVSDMEYLVGVTIINYLGVIKIDSTGKQKNPPVKLGNNPNEMIDVETMEKIIKDIPPDANIEIEIDDADDKNNNEKDSSADSVDDDKDGNSDNHEKEPTTDNKTSNVKMQLDEVADKLKNKYANFMSISFDENSGFLYEFNKNIDFEKIAKFMIYVACNLQKTVADICNTYQKNWSYDDFLKSVKKFIDQKFINTTISIPTSFKIYNSGVVSDLAESSYMLINKYNMKISVFSDDVSYIYNTIYKKEDSEIKKQIKIKADKIYKKINNILQLVEVIDTLVNDINILLTTINNTDLQINRDSEYKDNKQFIKKSININDIGHSTIRDRIDLEEMPWD